MVEFMHHNSTGRHHRPGQAPGVVCPDTANAPRSPPLTTPVWCPGVRSGSPTATSTTCGGAPWAVQPTWTCRCPCAGHHTWLHDHGYTLTREDGVLVFRDRLGRVIANTDHILADQLTQLTLLAGADGWATRPATDRPTPPDPPGSPTGSDLDQAAT